MLLTVKLISFSLIIRHLFNLLYLNNELKIFKYKLLNSLHIQILLDRNLMHNCWSMTWTDKYWNGPLAHIVGPVGVDQLQSVRLAMG